MPPLPGHAEGVADHPWWHNAVIYQVYPRSFADADADGHGDLQGVIDHLDHLAWLGVGAIWLNPISPSPNADWGYDVADYTAVDPIFGDLETLDRLVARAGDRGIRVLLDLVPNHTSDRHPWFIEARADRGSRMRDRYVWADPRPDGSPPNNWRSTFGGPAWTFDEATGQYYLHSFLPEQPDLNWWNHEVRSSFDEILRFWFDRGIAGFRIDVAHGLVKDRDLGDDLPATDEDHPHVRAFGLRQVNSMYRDEVHEVYRHWRKIADAYDPARILIGETWVFDLPTLMRFYGRGGDELDLALNVPFLLSAPGPEMRGIVEATEAAIPASAWPTWTGSNHDVGRFPSRWADGDERKTRAALVILLMLRGTPILYYGDEMGMRDVVVPYERVLDPVGRSAEHGSGRDGGRTPMPWTAEHLGGFTQPGVEPWLPLGDTRWCNVADQRADADSVLHLCRDLIALRRERSDLREGAYRPIEAPERVWAWRRGERTSVVINCSDHPVDVPFSPGRIEIGSRRARDGSTIGDRLPLEPWEAVVMTEG